MIKVLIELFVLYLLYKIIFDFIIPVARTTKQVKKQFTDMSNNMQDAYRRQQEQYNATQNTQQPIQKEAAKADDYIDFEEVK